MFISLSSYSEEPVNLNCIYFESMTYDPIDSEKLTDGSLSTSLEIFPESKNVLFDSSIFHSNRKANYVEKGNSIAWSTWTKIAISGTETSEFRDEFLLNRNSGILRWTTHVQKPGEEFKTISTLTANCKKTEPLF